MSIAVVLSLAEHRHQKEEANRLQKKQEATYTPPSSAESNNNGSPLSPIPSTLHFTNVNGNVNAKTHSSMPVHDDDNTSYNDKIQLYKNFFYSLNPALTALSKKQLGNICAQYQIDPNTSVLKVLGRSDIISYLIQPITTVKHALQANNNMFVLQKAINTNKTDNNNPTSVSLSMISSRSIYGHSVMVP